MMIMMMCVSVGVGGEFFSSGFAVSSLSFRRFTAVVVRRCFVARW